MNFAYLATVLSNQFQFHGTASPAIIQCETPQFENRQFTKHSSKLSFVVLDMLNAKRLLLLAALSSCCHCLYVPSRYNRCNTPECRETALKWFVVIAIFITALSIYFFVKNLINRRRMKTPCKKYTTSEKATPEKVYGQLRNKWMAHEEQMQFILNDRRNPIKMAAIEYNQWQRMTELMSHIKYESIKCKEFFPTPKHKPSMLADDVKDIPTLFADQVEMVESFAAKIAELDGIIRVNRKTCGGCCT